MKRARKDFFKKSIITLICGILLWGNTLNVVAESFERETAMDTRKTENSGQNEDMEKESGEYTSIMRRFHSSDKGGEELARDFEIFIEQETERLEKLDISKDRKESYISRLKKMQKGRGTEKEQKKEIKTPKNPAQFRFHEQDAEIKRLKNYNNNSINIVTLLFDLKTAYAEIFDIPTIEDIKSDTEIIINPTIKTIARELDGNPVKIVNFVKNNIIYGSYYGAKKGSMGCLEEGVCNDTDSASLTIALLRAAGIPARYKTGMAIFEMEQLKELLGVDNANSVYAALAFNKIPVYLVSGNSYPDNLAEADLSNETHLAVEWTLVEAFYEYDERKGNVNNNLNLNFVETNEELQGLLSTSPKKQWIPIDTVVRQYIHEQNTILADEINFNSETFFYDYLQYQGDLTPFEKYAQEIESASGLEMEENLSKKTPVQKEYQNLPITLPYALTEGETDDGVQVDIETFSALPDKLRYTIKISLLREETGEEVLSKTYFGSEINNKEITLTYEGFSDSDNEVMEEYGGVHATPAELVGLKAILRGDFEKYEGTGPVEIGESLILRFEYELDGELLNIDEKFSVAGNHEGIYVVLSKTLPHPFLNGEETVENRNSKILLEGNAAIAREYMLQTEKELKIMGNSLDYEHNIVFSRAVVTQNRILNPLDGTPTTFDFKGLTIDSGYFISDYSNGGNFSDHNKDFRLLWGLISSDYEARLFTDLAGLNGISTISGLRYAYGNPQTYKVYKINSFNKYLIDTFDISENTKNNMKADVDKGNVIITPDKFVNEGVWDGILYISLDENWYGKYAIGEQTSQNGGFTTDEMEVDTYCDESCASTYWSSNAIKKFVYEDRKIDSIACSISEEDYVNITDNSDLSNAPAYEKWASEYGAPCMKETKQFGDVTHTFILATNASKFHSSNKYNYWVKRSVAQNKIKENGDGYSKGGFKFNAIAGTYYSYNDDTASYYNPVQPVSTGADSWLEKGKVYNVSGDILSKLMDSHYEYSDSDTGCSYGKSYCGKKNWVLEKMGYPIGEGSGNVKSFYDTNGYYQTFIGGQVYVETDWLNKAYYMPSEIAKTFNNENYVGKFGFPIEDPIKDGAILYQDFEGGFRISSIGGVDDNSYKVVVEQGYEDGEYQNLMIEGLLDELFEGGWYGFAINVGMGITISQGIKIVKGYLIKNGGKKMATKITAKFIPYVGWTLAGIDAVLFAAYNGPMIDACNEDPFAYPPNPKLEEAKPAYYCGRLAGSAILVAIGSGIDHSVGKLNKFFVKTPKAKNGKTKLFGQIDNKYEANEIGNLLENNPKTRTEVSQWIDDLDTESIKKLDGPVLNRWLGKDFEFYGKFKVKSVLSTKSRNDYLKDIGYTDPLPYTPGKSVTELKVTNAVKDGDFVQFRTKNWAPSRFLIHKNDIPYLNNGKVDKDKLRKLFKLPPENEITEARKYLPQNTHTIFEGPVNQGADPNIMQYEFKGTETTLFDDIDDNELILIFPIDYSLTNLL